MQITRTEISYRNYQYLRKKRCSNYIDNQKGMINSILERSRRTIVLDRVLITDSVTQAQTLVTDPDALAVLLLMLTTTSKTLLAVPKVSKRFQLDGHIDIFPLTASNHCGMMISYNLLL